jgi:hypothetical protein
MTQSQLETPYQVRTSTDQDRNKLVDFVYRGVGVKLSFVPSFPRESLLLWHSVPQRV